MKLTNLTIEGFRRHWFSEIKMSNATFLIGENNVGKSTVLTAIEYLLSDKKKVLSEEFFHIQGDDEITNIQMCNKITITGEFTELPEESLTWRGFRGRVFPYSDGDETKYKVFLRKTFEPSTDYVVELKEYKKSIKSAFVVCKTLNDYIENGIPETIINELFEGVDRNQNLTSTQKKKFEDIEDLYEFDSSEDDWFKNPGGIPGNVLSKLPRVLIIPAVDKRDELSGNSGTLLTTLNSLFNDVRDLSENFKEAQRYLNLLASELDPANSESEFGRMMAELNGILSDVFPDSGIHSSARLADADKVIKPQFTVNMSSNIHTSVDLQGTGSIRAAVFALLRYRATRESESTEKNGLIRPLIICFEEPEIYLHPNAAQQMRNTIYDLANSERNQIVCTTHSPYMIDLGRNPNQVLNLLSLKSEKKCENGKEFEFNAVACNPFNTSKAFKDLQGDDKTYVKMLMKMDDHVSKVFFAKNVLIVEGDTEEVVLRETIDRLDDIKRRHTMHNWQIVKARGKASIIPLVKYLKSMGIIPNVMHDLDTGNKHAEKFNEPILIEVGDSRRVFPLKNCIEDILGYNALSNEKPFKAYKYINDNWSNFDSLPSEWKNVFCEIFGFDS